MYTHAVPGLTPFAADRWAAELIDAMTARLPGAVPPRRKVEVFASIDVLATAVMANHAHFVLEQGEDALAISRFTSNVLRSFALRFNSATGRRGPVFLKPYQSKLLETPGDAMTEIAYVHRNPKTPAGILARTSHAEYIGARGPGIINVERGLDLFGGRDAYEQFFDNYCGFRQVRDRNLGQAP